MLLAGKSAGRVVMGNAVRAAVKRLPWVTWGFDSRVVVEFEDHEGLRVDIIMDRARLVDLLADAALFLDDFGVAELNRRVTREWSRSFSDSPVPTTDLRYAMRAR